MKNKVNIFESFKEHILNTKIYENNLSKNTIAKPSKQNNNTRGFDLYNKILNKEFFKTTQTSKFKGNKIQINFINSEVENIFKNEDYDKLNALFKNTNYFVLLDDPTIFVKLTDLEKTAEFGSSRGFGGGSKSTEIQESLHALIFSYVINIKKNKVNINIPIKTKELQKAYEYIHVNLTLEQLINSNEYNDDEWYKSICLASNEFFAWLIRERQIKSKYEFHRKSKFMDSIYNQAKILCKKDNLKIKNDKWNPGDIWMTNKNGIKEITKKYNNLNIYNEKIKELNLNSDLIAISLKKISKVNIKQENATLTVNNLKDSIHQYTLKKMYLNGGKGHGKFTTNNKLILITNSGLEIHFRSFTYIGSWQGDILGSGAMGGKIGHGIINYFLKQNKLLLLSSQKELRKNIKTDKIKQYLYNKYKELSNQNNYTYEEFYNIIKKTYGNKINNYIYSKTLGIELYESLSNKNAKAVNNVVNSIINYAKSNSNFSSAFIKIE